MRFLLVWLLLLVPVRALAQTAGDKTTARDLFFSARDALEAERFEDAADLFERSNELYPAPTAALGLARSLVGMGQLVRAHETYATIRSTELADDASAPFKRAVEKARDEQAALVPRLSAVVLIVVGPEEPVVTIDGAPVSPASLGRKRFVDPGQHAVGVHAPGFVTEERSVTLAEGETTTVRFDLVAAPEPSPQPAAPAPALRPPPRAADTGMPPMQLAGVLVGTLGAVSLVASALTGGFYLSKRSVANEQCTETAPDQFQCETQAGVDAAAAGRKLAIANMATLIFGAVALGTGIGLYAFGDERGAEVGLVGSF